MISQLAAVGPPHHLSGPCVSSKGPKQHLAVAPRCQKHALLPPAPGTRRQEAQQLRSCVAAAAPGSSPSNAAAPAAEPSDADEDVAVSTMDALLTVMDDGTSEPEEQAPAAASSGREVPAAVLEAAAELISEGSSSYNPEDAMRYGSLSQSHGVYSPGLPTLCSRLHAPCSCHLPAAHIRHILLITQYACTPDAHNCLLCSSNLPLQRPAESLCQHSGACSPGAGGAAVSSRGVWGQRQP